MSLGASRDVHRNLALIYSVASVFSVVSAFNSYMERTR